MRNLISSHAARCLAGSLLKTASPDPELVGTTGFDPNEGSLVASSSQPFALAPVMNCPCRALVSRIIPSWPLLNALNACCWSRFGITPLRTRSAAIDTASTAGASAKDSLLPSAESTRPPAERTMLWKHQSPAAFVRQSTTIPSVPVLCLIARAAVLTSAQVFGGLAGSRPALANSVLLNQRIGVEKT